MTRFKVTVTRADWVTRTAGKEWAVIDKEGNRGYTPEIEKKTWESHEVYEQTVENLDLRKVVAVVNGLDPFIDDEAFNATERDAGTQ